MKADSLVIADVLKILDPNCFWNLVLLAGVAFIVLSQSKLIKVGPFLVQAPEDQQHPPDRSRRRSPKPRASPPPRPLLWIGIVMILVAIGFMLCTNWAGLVSPVQKGKPPKEPDEHTSFHLVPATANLAQISVSASEPNALATLTIVARHETRAPAAFGSNVIVYIGAINLLGRSRLLIYHSDSPPDAGEIHYHILQPKLLKEQIILDNDVTNHQTIDFTCNGQNFRAVIELKWFLRGDNYAVIKVYKR